MHYTIVQKKVKDEVENLQISETKRQSELKDEWGDKIVWGRVAHA